MEYQSKFLEKGLFPLEIITNTKQKVSCIDKDGYKYLLSYDLLNDKRTKRPDKWKKQNPFKAYNMRLYASTVQENVEILSSDEELKESTTVKIKFKCPNCGTIYEKKWCHWLNQPNNVHFCYDCMIKYRSSQLIYTYRELIEMYQKYGYVLLDNYDYYLQNGKSYARMACQGKDGYKYAINLNSLRSGNNSGSNRYAFANPFAIENLQKFCDEHYLNVKIVAIEKGVEETKALFVIQCECGELFKASAYKITNYEQIRCCKCSGKRSSYEQLTYNWLKENKIDFEGQYSFNDCRKIRPLPFDFKCNYKGKIILIETDGPQHFYEIEYFTSETLIERQEKDKIKTEYCLKNNITLVRIPYWDYQNNNYLNILNQTFFG